MDVRRKARGATPGDLYSRREKPQCTRTAASFAVSLIFIRCRASRRRPPPCLFLSLGLMRGRVTFHVRFKEREEHYRENMPPSWSL